MRLLFVKCVHAKSAAPGSFGWLLDGRFEAVHMIAPVAIVAEQKFVVVFGGAADGAALAFDTLPRILFHRYDHVVGELQTRRMTGSSTFRADDKFFGFARFLVVKGIA